ncbi:hypothetical protein OTU49_012578 [Cherax quadricarinatus]|uniref:3CxxC-type domain-containing protein n=2 Tax=Cherax quadricarinatus TaxID=27406 RepID=A0AAW0VXZ0_CHEQU
MPNGENAIYNAQPNSPVPINSGSPIYCDTYVGYGSPYPCVMYTVCPVMPMTLSSPSDDENRNDESYRYDYSGQALSPEPTYASPPCLLLSQVENFEDSSRDSTPPVIVTNILPDHTSSDVSPPVPVTEESQENNSEPDKPDIGVFGANGCWYPTVKSNSKEFNVKIEIPDSLHASETTMVKHSEWQPCDIQNTENPYSSPPLSSRPSVPVFGVATSQRVKPTLPKYKPQPVNVSLPFYNCYHHLDLSPNILGRPRLLHTLHKDGQLSVEDLWQKHLMVLFRNLPDEWVLGAAHPSKKFGPSWHSFKDLAKVRFYCRSCRDGWTSMYGVVVFYYRWDRQCFCGQIYYQIPGQKCKSCNPNEFEVPMWYPEEAQKVITNLYYKIAAHVYNLLTPQYIRTRRLGKPITHHDKQLCQGCCQGVCKIECSKEMGSMG